MNRVALPHYPYADRDRIWILQNRVSSGAIASPLVYDPNRQLYVILNGDLTTSGVVGYRPLRVTLEFANGTVARPDVFGALQPGDVGQVGPEILTPCTVDQEYQLLSQDQQNNIEYQLGKAKPADREALRQQLVAQGLLITTATGRQTVNIPAVQAMQKTKTQTVTLQAVQTQFKPIVTGPQGVALSLYWHRSRDDSQALGSSIGSDVLISPANYTVDADTGIIVVRSQPPGGDRRYDSFTAYYYYQRSEGSRLAQDPRSTNTLPVSGIDFAGSLTQGLPVTRNMTDYVNGQVGSLTPANLDDLQPDYYPVYEYMLDDRGRLVFANNFANFGDTPAQVTVEYESLMIEPRLIIEYAPAALNFNFSPRGAV